MRIALFLKVNSFCVAYRYFDADGDGKVDLKEFRAVMERDLATMAANKPEKKIEGRKRDPGIAWILDFNNDGIVSVQVGSQIQIIIMKSYSSVMRIFS